MTSAELERMGLKELRLLKDQIDSAIRAAIARSKAPAAPAPQPELPKIDLERERDAWKARRAASGSGI